MYRKPHGLNITIEDIFFCYLTTDGSFTQDFILKNCLNYFTVDAKPFDVYEHPLQACRLSALMVT